MTAYDCRTGETYQFACESAIKGEVEERLFDKGGSDLGEKDAVPEKMGGPQDRNSRIQLYETE